MTTWKHLVNRNKTVFHETDTRQIADVYSSNNKPRPVQVTAKKQQKLSKSKLNTLTTNGTRFPARKQQVHIKHQKTIQSFLTTGTLNPSAHHESSEKWKFQKQTRKYCDGAEHLRANNDEPM